VHSALHLHLSPDLESAARNRDAQGSRQVRRSLNSKLDAVATVHLAALWLVGFPLKREFRQVVKGKLEMGHVSVMHAAHTGYTCRPHGRAWSCRAGYWRERVGRKMTTASEANRTDLLRYLRIEADQSLLIQRLNARGRAHVPRTSYVQLILDHGREMAPMVTSGPSRVKPNACFANALLLMANRKAVFYCEGYAVPMQVGLPMHHAWCVDAKGRVLDPTWEQNSLTSKWYYGLTFTRDYALRRLKAQSARGGVGSLLVMCSDDDHGLVTGATPLEAALTQWRTEGEVAVLDPGRQERLDALEATLGRELHQGPGCP